MKIRGKIYSIVAVMALAALTIGGIGLYTLNVYDQRVDALENAATLAKMGNSASTRHLEHGMLAAPHLLANRTKVNLGRVIFGTQAFSLYLWQSSIFAARRGGRFALAEKIGSSEA
jgi:hypothetical protein